MPLFAQAAQSATNPMLGVLIFAVGGLAGAAFYLPFKKVKGWAWESYWLIYAVFGLLVVPWVLALTLSPNVVSVLRASPPKALGYCFLCGAMWGAGGLTWGLMIRYLGFGLGLAIGGGLCSAAGTLVPPVLNPVLERFFAAASNIPLSEAIYQGVQGLYHTTPAKVALARRRGVAAGHCTRRRGRHEQGKRIARGGEKEGHRRVRPEKGHVRGDFFRSDECRHEPRASGRRAHRKTGPRNQPHHQRHLERHARARRGAVGRIPGQRSVVPAPESQEQDHGRLREAGAPLAANLFFAGLAGVIWCSQFVCFKTGASAMGKLGYIGWSVLFASLILFGTLLGIFFGEWRNTSARTRWLLSLGLVLLASSAAISGLSGYLK